MTRYGLLHVAHAAAKHSISDPMWVLFVDKVLCKPNSALPFSLAKEPCQILLISDVSGMDKSFKFSNSMYGIRNHFMHGYAVFGTINGQLELLRPHTLVVLNLIDHFPMDILQDRSKALRLFGNSNVSGSPYKKPSDRAYDMPPDDSVTALQLALASKSHAAVETVLRVTQSLYGQDAQKMLARHPNGMPPIIAAIIQNDVAIIKTLLQFGLGSFQAKSSTQGAHQHPVANQWSLEHLGLTVEHWAAVRLSKIDFHNLLHVAKPKEKASETRR